MRRMIIGGCVFVVGLRPSGRAIGGVGRCEDYRGAKSAEAGDWPLFRGNSTATGVVTRRRVAAR